MRAMVKDFLCKANDGRHPDHEAIFGVLLAWVAMLPTFGVFAYKLFF